MKNHKKNDKIIKNVNKIRLNFLHFQDNLVGNAPERSITCAKLVGFNVFVFFSSLRKLYPLNVFNGNEISSLIKLCLQQKAE